MSVHESPLVADGRRRRSERTRLSIIEAYLELLRRNSVMPTAAQLADQAGCSVRSIFERFSDLNALSLATADYAIAKGQAEAVPRDVDGSRSMRIRSHVETRALACERWLPLWRIIAGLDQPELRMRVQFARLANVERMKLMYRFELSLLAEAGRAADRAGNVDQLRELGPDAPLLRTFDRGRASGVAVHDRPHASIG